MPSLGLSRLYIHIFYFHTVHLQIPSKSLLHFVIVYFTTFTARSINSNVFRFRLYSMGQHSDSSISNAGILHFFFKIISMLFGLRMMEMGVKWHGWRRVGFLNQGFPEWPFDFASLEEVFQEVEALRTGGRAP